MTQALATASERSEPLKTWIRALEAIRVMDQAPETTLVSLLDNLARANPDGPALLSDDEELTFPELAEQSNRIARWARAQDLAARGNVPGKTVCLLMPNRPAYVATWLGLTRAGCIVALINTNLTGDSLLHSISAAGASHLIVDSTLVPAIVALAGRLPPVTKTWVHGVSTSGAWPGLGPQLERLSGARIEAAEQPFPSPSDVALLIYTSGTTGLPKAAKVTHGRILEWSLWFAGMMDVRPTDRLYNCLPMYHSTGGIIAIGAMLVRGGSVLIGKRFSASQFWDDVVDGHCTIFQYIGELCRYLTLSPAHPKERQHQLRLACGNGLQGGVWEAFQRRFAVPRILEFYAATEGNVSLYNCEGKPGAIGRVPPFLASRFPIALIRCDPETGTPLRGATGYCIPCDPDETGEAIGRVDAGTRSPARQFDGYTDADASMRKVMRDVFSKGDCWFRTGDLMRKDAAGYYFFVDRVGDTFRWKGENVSTTEVAAAIRACPGVTDAVVYGVVVPGHEGRAGMAAITADDQFNLASFAAYLSAELPGYAQPLFVRLCRSLEVTGTLKLTKAKLVKEGYTEPGDPIWFNDRFAGCYVPCDADVLCSIREGSRRL